MMLRDRFGHWAEVRRGLEWLLGRLSDDDLAFVPTPGGWSLGRIFVHIADAETYWLDSVVAGNAERDLVVQAGPAPGTGDIRDLLAETHAASLALLESLDDATAAEARLADGETVTIEWVVWHVVEHKIHHRGEISLALGLLGRPGLDV